jgi:hypothetical protein
MSDRTLPVWLRLILVATTAMQIVFGVTLLLNPAAVAGLWPWKLTPITARLLGASSLVSIPLSVLSAVVNRYAAARIPLVMSLLYRVFQIVAGLTALSRFDFSKVITWNYFGGGVVMMFVFAYAWLRGPQLGRPVESRPSWLRGTGALSLGVVRWIIRFFSLLYLLLGFALLILGPGAASLWFEAPGQLTPLTARLFAGTVIGLSIGLWLMSRAREWFEVSVSATGLVTIGGLGALALLLEWQAIAPASPLGYLSASVPLVVALVGAYLLLVARRLSRLPGG